MAADKPEVVFYYVNGVLNSEGQALVSAQLIASRLSALFGKNIQVSLKYNVSSADPALTMLDGCEAAAGLDPNRPAAGLAAAVCQQAKICAAPGLLLQTATEALAGPLEKMVAQKVADPNFASDPLNAELADLVRSDVAAGKRVVIISHSQGTLFLRNVLGRLTDLPAGSVGGFYIAPAFGSGDDLNTPATRFVLLKGDGVVGPLSNSTTTDPTPNQESGGLHLHHLKTYLEPGSTSLAIFLQGMTELVNYVSGGAQLPPAQGGHSGASLVAYKPTSTVSRATDASWQEDPAANSARSGRPEQSGLARANASPGDCGPESPAPTTQAVDPLDRPFAYPQYLVHAIGHGTTSGGVADDFYTLLNAEPDANGHYTIPDGSGGTIGYASDFHTGPLLTPRAVCEAAAARGAAPQTWTVAYDYNTTFDCPGP